MDKLKSRETEELHRSGLGLTKDYDNFKKIYDPELFRQICEESHR